MIVVEPEKNIQPLALHTLVYEFYLESNKRLFPKAEDTTKKEDKHACKPVKPCPISTALASKVLTPTQKTLMVLAVSMGS